MCGRSDCAWSYVPRRPIRLSSRVSARFRCKRDNGDQRGVLQVHHRTRSHSPLSVSRRIVITCVVPHRYSQWYLIRESGSTRLIMNNGSLRLHIAFRSTVRSISFPLLAISWSDKSQLTHFGALGRKMKRWQML